MLCGRYLLEQKLGSGGMAVVYRARDLLHEQFGDPDPRIAVKLLNDDFTATPDAGVLLYREFALTRHLCHPHVARLRAFEVDLRCQRAFITQDLLPGIGLDALLCEQPAGMDDVAFNAMAVPLLDALAHVHQRGVIHGDLKPNNVMLTGAGPVIIDFGLAEPCEDVLAGLPRLARGRFDAWTPAYAAPELLDGAVPSLQSDVYAMACVLYEMAGGRHPFGKMLPAAGRDQRLWRSLGPPSNLPSRFWPALRHALTPDAHKRTINAQELHDAFRVQPIWRMQF